MTTLDAHKNFAFSTVATAPTPATSGTSLVVASGDGALFPAPATAGAFNLVVCPVGVQATASNAEIVRCTARTTDTLTITRTQESTSARTIVAGDQVFLAVTSKTATDIEDYASGVGDQITGEQTLPRYAATDFSTGVASGVLHLGFFTALSNAVVTTCGVYNGTTAHVTATITRFGLYTVDSGGAGTLVANTVNDTALLAASFNVYSKALASSYTFIRGQRYAAGIIQLAATPATPLTAITSAQFVSGGAGTLPRISGELPGQTDLPSSFTHAGLSTSTRSPYLAFT